MTLIESGTSIAMLMGSAVITLRRGLPALELHYPGTIAGLWPEFIPLTHEIALGVNVIKSDASLGSTLSLLTSEESRKAFISLDSSGGIVPDHKTRLVLSRTRLIRGSGTPLDTRWCIYPPAITPEALLRLEDWYKKTLVAVVLSLKPVLDHWADPFDRQSAIMITVGQVARLSAPVKSSTSLLRGLSQGDHVHHPSASDYAQFTLWARPRDIWKTCLVMAQE